MSARHASGSARCSGLGTMLRIVARIQRRRALTWVLVLGGSMVGTAASVASLYDTPAKIRSYAEAVTAGNALVVVNGRVEGLDSLGGVIQDEFGFMAAFLLPLLGISLVARATRLEEESGRLEPLLGGRIARHVPTSAAFLVAVAAIVATGVLFAVGLLLVGVPAPGAVLYACSLGALAIAFAGLAAMLAQLTLHTRGVYAWSLIVLAASYVLRGVGDVTSTWVTWLSPLGWAEKTAPFGDRLWWVLVIPVAVGGLLGGTGLRLAARRDLGSALVRGGPGPQDAGSWLRSSIGLAAWIHRPSTAAWLAGAVMLAGTMGALSQQFVDAMAGNPALATAIGVTGGRPLDGMLAATQVYVAVIAAGYVVQSVGMLGTEESRGRVETQLAGSLSRTRWLCAHALVVFGGLVAIVLSSSVVLGVATVLSVGDTAELGPALRSGSAYLPAELVLGGWALAVYGLRPRWFGLAWAGYGLTAFIGLLGPALRLYPWVRDLSPTTHVGNPPSSPTHAGALVLLGAVAVVLGAVGLAGFRRRGVPQV